MTSERKRFLSFTVFCTAALAAAYPPAYSVLRWGDRAVTMYVNGDALLYLTIARESSGAFFTHDGSTPTNGFHPLWQIFLAAFLGRDTPVGSMDPLYLAFFSSLVSVAVGAGLSALAIHRYTKSFLLSLLVVPGVYYALFGSLFSNLSIWSAVSGMEAGFSTLFGGAFLYALARAVTGKLTTFDDLYGRHRGIHPVVPLGLLLPFVILSRLDDALIVPALALALWLLDDRPRSLSARALLGARLLGPSCLLVAGYMLFNKVQAGTFLPVSGQTKSGIAIHQNLWVALASLFPPALDARSSLQGTESNYTVLYTNAFRWAELLGPALLSGAYLVYQRSLGNALRYALPAGLAGYVIFKALYNLVCVNLWHQSDWYFAFSALVVSFLAGISLKGVAERIRALPRVRYLVPLGYLCYVLVAASRSIVPPDLRDDVELAYLQDRGSIRKSLRERIRDPKLLAFDDGVTAYALPFSTIHGFCFAADLPTAKALNEKRLLRHAYQRGHRILTSGIYFPVKSPLPSSDEARRFLKTTILEQNVKDELDAFDFELVYVHEKTGAPFFELEERQPSK